MSDAESSQVTKNCHYISRFLTVPWQFSDQRGDKQLHFYDFDTDTFSYKSARNLFAADALNKPKVETWLRDVIETPLGAVKARLASADPHALDDRRFFRAAILMLWLQGIRAHSVADEDDRRHLEKLSSMPMEYIDALVGLIGQDFDLRLAFTFSDGGLVAPLCVPSTGTFPLTFPDPGCMSRYSHGIGLALTPECALITTPTEERGQLDLSQLRPSLANRSIGTSPSRRVVLDPKVRETVSEDQLRRDLREMRANNDLLAEGINKIRGLIADGFATVGIEVATDRVGRLPPIDQWGSPPPELPGGRHRTRTPRGQPPDGERDPSE